MTTYTGRVWIDHWHDGDTFYGVIDPGWGLTLGGEHTKFERIRMAGINAPELGDPVVITDTNRAGHDALEYAEKIAPEKAFYDYVGHNRDKYGRPLMDIFVPKFGGIVGKWFSADMLEAGHAVVMKG